MRRRALLLPWLFAFACSDGVVEGRLEDSGLAPDLGPTDAGADGGPSDLGADAGAATSDAGEDAGSGEAGADLGPADSGALATVGVELFDAVSLRADPRPRMQPVPATLHRVEMTAGATLRFTVPSQTTRVEMETDGTVRTDESAPWVLTEDSGGAPVAWLPAAGTHAIVVRAYDGDTLVARGSFSFEWSEAGTEAAFTSVDVLTWVYACIETEGDREISSDCAGLGGNWSGSEPSHFQTFQGTSDSIGYRVFVPKGYDPSVEYPLLVHLHGYQTILFEDPVGGADENERRTRIAVQSSSLFTGSRSLVSPNYRDEHPAIVVVPQCICECDARRDSTCPATPTTPSDDYPAVHEWSEWQVADSNGNPIGDDGLDYPETGALRVASAPSTSGGLVLELVDALAADGVSVEGTTLNVDAGRIYLTGESMGGIGTWDLAGRRPQLFAAVIPMAGFTDETTASLMSSLPVWSFHHADDLLNPVDGTCRMVQTLGGTIDPSGTGVCASPSPATRDDVRMTRYEFATSGLFEAHLQTFERAWTTETDLYPWIFSRAR